MRSFAAPRNGRPGVVEEPCADVAGQIRGDKRGAFGRGQAHLLDHRLGGPVAERADPDQGDVGVARRLKRLRNRILPSQQGDGIRPVQDSGRMQISVVRTQPQREFPQEFLPGRRRGHRGESADQLKDLHIDTALRGHRPDQVLQGRAPGEGDLLPVPELVNQPGRSQLSGPTFGRRSRLEPRDQRLGAARTGPSVARSKSSITTGRVQNAYLDDSPLAGCGEHA